MGEKKDICLSPYRIPDTIKLIPNKDKHEWLVINTSINRWLRVTDKAIGVINLAVRNTLEVVLQQYPNSKRKEVEKLLEVLLEGGFIESKGSNPSHITDGKPHRRAAYLHVTEACNLTCPYCYYFLGNNKALLPLNKIDTVARRLKKANVQALIISGGEPLLHPDIFEIARQLRNAGFREMVLLSNGLLLGDGDNARLAAELFDSVQMSMTPS